MEIGESYGADVKGVDTLAETMSMVINDQVDATINAATSVQDYLHTTGETKVEVIAQLDEATAYAIPLVKGADNDSLRAAIGPCIGKCCFEVKEDFIEEVTALRGADFARRHIARRGEKYFADTVSMNVEILTSCGIKREFIDVSGECTACDPETYHSHRATRGLRGTMGNVIGIV